MSRDPIQTVPIQPDTGVPDGYAAIPIAPGQDQAPLRVCILCRLLPEETAGHLVVLRDAADGSVLLGCVTDAAGHLHQWLEIRIQNIEAAAAAPLTAREALSNAVLDERWRRYAAAFQALEPRAIIQTGAESEHPLPVWLDVAAKRPIHATDADTGEAWRLCKDEALLSAAGLPPYGASLHRYLYLRGRGGQTFFVPATAGAPENERTRPQALEPLRGLLPLNPSAGLILVSAYSPFGIESFLNLLGGAPDIGLMHGRSPLKIDAAAREVDEEHLERAAGGWLFMGQHGQWGRLLETFHLKLRLLADMTASVRALVQRTQCPLLTLDADSFQVRLGEAGSGLPLLWTARAVLVDPGSAVELPIHASDARYFLPARSVGNSIYRPAETVQVIHGRCTVRIRKVLEDVGGATIVEGTFSTQERLVAARNDLVWIRMSLARGPVDLYARLESEPALARGEWRFRTIPQRMAATTPPLLKAAEGVPIAHAAFDLLPLLSTPCDLYSLGVLAVRALLVNGEVSLPVALDEIMSLAREMAQRYDAGDPLRLRVRAIFEGDKRWLEALGPQRLAWKGMRPGQAFDFIPPELWWDTLAMIAATFPGVGPDSTCQELGEGPLGGLHKVFDRAAKDLENLLLRTRSLIVIDWRFNREIHAVIRARLTGVAKSE